MDKRVVIKMEAPGSSGEVEIIASEEEVEFLRRVQNKWNDVNGAHSQPYMELEVFDKGEKK